MEKSGLCPISVWFLAIPFGLIAFPDGLVAFPCGIVPFPAGFSHFRAVGAQSGLVCLQFREVEANSG